MSLHCRSVAASLVITLLGLVSPVFAQIQTQPSVYWAPEEARPGSSADNAFEPSHFDFGLGGQGLTTFNRHSESLGFLTFHAGYHLLDTVSLNLELGIAPGNLLDDRYIVRAFDGLVFARWHLLKNDNFSIFADGGLGGLHARNHFPIGGRPDNVLLAAGLGASCRLGENAHAALYARYVHLSGGDLFSSRDARPSDAIQYGLEFVFVR